MRRLLETRSPVGLVVALALSILLPGCGGGGGAPQAAPISLTIDWPARTRDLNAPSSALSAVVTLEGARPGGGDFVWVIPRRSAPAAYSESYTSTSLATLGVHDVWVSFCALSDGTGSVVGVAVGSVDVGSGMSLGNLTTEGTVAAVRLASGQTVDVGQTKDLAFSCRDKAGDLIVVSPGAAALSIVSGSACLQALTGPAVKGLAPGSADVALTVDGVTSGQQTVAVASDTTVAVTPTSYTMPVGGTHTFAATVTGSTSTNGSVIWSVQEGASGGAVDAAGVYTAPAHRGVYHVVATSVYDTSKSKSATVTVQSGDISGTIN